MTDGEMGRPTRPALPTLQRDQRALLDPDRDAALEHGLRDGFPDRRRALHWYQAAIVRTLGHVTRAWPCVDFVRDHVLVQALVASDQRHCWTGDGGSDVPLTDDEARGYRRKLEANALIPAFDAAYNDLRTSAGEYIDQGDPDVNDDDLDPGHQRHLAMRPGFQEADRQQRAALDQLWGGFEDEDALLHWLHELDRPTNGAVENRLSALVSNDRTLKAALLDAGDLDGRMAARVREEFVATELLPAFADGIQRMDAGELVSRRQRDMPAPSG